MVKFKVKACIKLNSKHGPKKIKNPVYGIMYRFSCNQNLSTATERKTSEWDNI